MTTTFRPTTSHDGTVIQGSLTKAEGDYRDIRLTKLVLGVILEVYPSDQSKTRSAQQTIDRHGHTHECSVLVVNEGSSSYTMLENVIITPDAPCGLDDYSERLPRPSTIQVDGSEYRENMQHIDPYDLDGDWCVVAFLGGRIEAPFILRWWPHARNTFDTATSGAGYDNTALEQARRYFRRVNGVESVVTSKGDIIVSTTYANSSLAPGADHAKGRFARNINEQEGGSIRINIKPSQFMELTFNPQEDGIGNVDNPEPEMPQTNPPTTDPQASGDRPETYIYVDRDQLDFYIPDTFNVVVGTDINVTADNDITVEAKTDINVTADNNATITAGSTLELQGELIKIGNGAEENPVVLGEELKQWFDPLLGAFQILSPFGPLRIDPAALLVPYEATQSKKSVVE